MKTKTKQIVLILSLLLLTWTGILLVGYALSLIHWTIGALWVMYCIGNVLHKNLKKSGINPFS